MLKYFGLLSCLVILVVGKELPKSKRYSKPDLAVIESQEHNFQEAPSNRRYQQNNNGGYEEGNSAPEPYMFNFDIQDNDNNKQFRKESSDGNAVKGSYGYLDSSGLYRTVDYTADSENGFQAKIRTNEPGMDSYYLDNNGNNKQFPADVILEVVESPRNLQYSSSDQISNNYNSGDNYNYNQQQNSKTKAYPQQQPLDSFSEPADQYAASNYNFKKAQGLGRANVSAATYEQPKIANEKTNRIKWNSHSNWSNQDKFEHQSSFSSSHPIYVDSDSKLINLNNNSSLDRSANLNSDVNDANLKFNVIKNQKFSNKLLEKPKDNQQPKKFLTTNLQLEKPIQEFRHHSQMQNYRPFNEIRTKFLHKQPRMYTRYLNFN